MSCRFALSRNFPCGSRRQSLRGVVSLWCTTILLIFVVSGCVPSVPERNSPVELPLQFSTSGGMPLSDQWWQSFNDPVLDKLMVQALEGNLSLKMAWDRLKQAEAVSRKVTADASPTLDAEGRAARNWVDGGGQSSGSSYSFGLVAGYEVDLWGRVRSQRDAAVLDAVAGEQDLKTAAVTISAQVATTWYQLVEQYGQADMLNQQMDTNIKALELISLRFRTGQVGIADVLQQRQLIETNRGELARINARAKVLEHQLAVLAGLTPDRQVVPLREDFTELPPLPTTGVPADLVRSRPDIKAAWTRLEAADHRLAVAIADRFPRLSLSGQLSTEAVQVGDLFDNWLTSLAGNLIGPLVDGGRLRAEVDRNRAVVAEVLHGYGQAVLDALIEVEDALVREQQQRRYLAHLEKQLGFAELAMDRIRDRYLNGAEDYQRVLTALLSFQGLQRSRLTAQRELYEYRIQLCRALAGGWEMQKPETALPDGDPDGSLRRIKQQ